jgi:hypothetical protein
MFYRRNIIQLNNCVCNFFSEKMVLDWNMLSLGMKNRIVRDTNGTGVITMNWNGISVSYLQICKSLCHP